MCGRFTLTSEIKAIRDHFSAIGQVDFNRSYNITPSQHIPVIRPSTSGREVALCHWGLIPHWAKQDNKYRAINARAETLSEKPFFRDAFRQRRCLIPANGFYEWKKENGSRQPWYINLTNSPIFAFAGLWETWQGNDNTVESCTIITTPANKQMQPIHDRMPAIISHEDYEEWLNTGTDKLLVPYQGDMECYPVNKAVNNPRNNSIDLVKPLT